MQAKASRKVAEKSAKKKTKKKSAKKKTKKKAAKKTTEKRGPGQPTKYKKEFCQQVIDLGKKGTTIAQTAMKLDVCRDTVHEWSTAHPEFSDALKKAYDFRMAWFEKELIAGMWGGKLFNTGPAVFLMKNMFRKDYSDRPIGDQGESTKKFELAYNLEDDE